MQSLARQIPSSPAAPLVVHDLDCGGLLQLARVVNLLLEAGHRHLVLNLSDPHFPQALCGEHTFDPERAQHLHMHVDDGSGRLFLEEAGRSSTQFDQLDQQTEMFLQTFLRHVGDLNGHFRGQVSVGVNVYRRATTLAARVAAGAVPPSNIFLGIDLNRPCPCEPEEANCLLLRDGDGLYGAMRHEGRAPQAFVLPGRAAGEAAAERVRSLRALLPRWGEPAHFVAAVAGHASQGALTWLDWPLLRLSSSVATAGAPGCSVFTLIKDLPDAPEASFGNYHNLYYRLAELSDRI